MNAERYRFNVGAFECIVVSDGTFAYPHPARLFFANAPAERLSQALHEHGLDPAQWEHYISPYPSLVINTGEHLVLVDTGAGTMAPTTGRLMANLQAEGIAPEAIDTVILTHAHPDHIGGNVDGEGRPAFPNARYVMGKQEWDFWMGDPDLSTWQVDEQLKALILACPRENLPPIEKQLDLIEGETEIVPGVRYVAAPGHTPGHMAVTVSSEGTQLVHLADAVVHPIHLEHPEWYSPVDLMPEQTVATRRRLLEQVAAEQVLVLIYHFTFPCLGHVVQHKKAWRWQPVGRVDLATSSTTVVA